MPEMIAQADAVEVPESQLAVKEEHAGEAQPKNLPTSSTSPTDENPSNSGDSTRDDSGSQGSNPNVAPGDLEAGAKVVGLEEGKVEAREVQQTSRAAALWRWRRLIALFFFMTGLAVLSCFLFYPRDPTWHITKLDIDIAKFSQIMMGQGNVTDPLDFSAEVEFFNPNLVGATTEPGTFEVLYKGAVMSYGKMGSITAGPKSSSALRVDVTAKFTEEMAQSIMAEVMSTWELKVKADVNTVAKVGLMGIKTRVQCDITASVTTLLQKPEDVLTEKVCTYSYSL